MDTAQTEKLKALALAIKGWNWESAQEAQFGHKGEDGEFYDVATVDVDQYGDDPDQNCNAAVASFCAAANPATVLELIADNERLRAEIKAHEGLATAKRDIFSELMEGFDALEGAHAVETLDQKAENALLWCYRRLKNSYGRLPFVEEAVAGLRARTTAAGPAREGGNTSENVVVEKPDENDAKTAGTCMDTGFGGAGKISAPAAGTDKDAERFRFAIALDDNAETLYAAVMNNAPDAIAIRAEFDAAILAHTKAREGA